MPQYDGNMPFEYQPNNGYGESTVPDQYMTWPYTNDAQNYDQSTNVVHAHQTNDLSLTEAASSSVTKSGSDVERRREQNRRAQKTHRERKDRHVKYLEGQLEQMRDQYRRLDKDYATQTKQLFKLMTKMEELQWELRTVQGTLSWPPAKFDATRMGWHGSGFDSEK